MMSEAEKPLFGDIKEEARSLGGELAEMAALRWQLAQAELRSDLMAARRLAVWLAIVAVMALTSLPLLAVCLAEVLGGWLGISRAGWLLILALGLLTATIPIGILAWRGFRRRFTGMEESLDELREDIVWLNEWAGRGDDARHP
jgi:hypothetical protein